MEEALYNQNMVTDHPIFHGAKIIIDKKLIFHADELNTLMNRLKTGDTELSKEIIHKF